MDFASAASGPYASRRVKRRASAPAQASRSCSCRCGSRTAAPASWRSSFGKVSGASRFAHGLHEVLGLAYKDGWLYVTQRCDVSRIKDTDADGKADLFEVVSDGWEISGDYHEYCFGSRFDKDGNIWLALCLTGSFTSDTKFRGWAGKVTPKGKFIPTTSGVRSPGGVGFNADGDVFYTDNQGPWNGACAMKHLAVGGFVGHPDGLRLHKETRAE